METTNKTTSVKKYTAIRDSFIGPLKQDQIRESEIEVKNLDYEEIDYSLLGVSENEQITYDTEEKSYASMFVEEYGDIDGDGKITTNDVEVLKQYVVGNFQGPLMKTGDVNGDGIISIADISVLQLYLNGEDVTSYINEISLLKYQYKKELDGYENEQKVLEEEIDYYEYILSQTKDWTDENYQYYYKMTGEQMEQLLQEKKLELASLKETIRSEKKVFNLLPYLEKFQTKDFIDYKESYKSNWQENIDYEDIANYYTTNQNSLKNYSKVDDKDVDWLAVVEYLVEEKGCEIGKYDELRDTYLNYLALSEEQRVMYHYLFETQGKQSADKYLSVLEDDINNYIGKMRADEWIENIAKSVKYDENGNIEQAYVDTTLQSFLSTYGKGSGEGMQNFYAGMFKWGEDGYSTEEYEKMYIMSYLESNGFLTGTYNAGVMAGNITTAMTVSTFFTMLGCPQAGMIVTNAIGTASAGGEANHYALLNGNSSDKAMEYAMKTMKNQLVTQLFSGVPGVGITLGKGSSIINVLMAGITSSSEVYSDAKLRESILNETINMDEVDLEASKAFFSSMIIAGISEGGSRVFNVTKGGENFEFSTDDCIRYFKENSSATLDDLVKNIKENNSLVLEIDPETGALYQSTTYEQLELLNSSKKFKIRGKNVDEFGGDQASLISKYKKLFKNSDQKNEIVDIVEVIKKDHPNFTDKDIERMLTNIKESGCSYVATTNIIFEQLGYNDEQFKSKFGYSMINSDGTLNHDKLITDLYSYLSDKIEVNVTGFRQRYEFNDIFEAAEQLTGIKTTNSNDAFMALFNNGYMSDGINSNNKLVYSKFVNEPQSFMGTPNEIIKQLTGTNSDITTSQEMLNYLKSNDISASISSSSNNSAKFSRSTSVEKWLNNYFEARGIELTVECKTINTQSYGDIVNDINYYISNGYSIGVDAQSLVPISMTDGSKLGWVTIGDTTGHAMTLRGFDNDGNILVSSWGKIYTIPKEYSTHLAYKAINLK